MCVDGGFVYMFESRVDMLHGGAFQFGVRIICFLLDYIARGVKQLNDAAETVDRLHGVLDRRTIHHLLSVHYASSIDLSDGGVQFVISRLEGQLNIRPLRKPHEHLSSPQIRPRVSVMRMLLRHYQGRRENRGGYEQG